LKTGVGKLTVSSNLTASAMKKTGNIRLSVNLNKVALLRNSRTTGIPRVVDFSDAAIEAGADGITLHPRSDERHVRETDVTEIAKRMKPIRPHKELNIEGYPDERFIKIIERVRPEQVTLVPDAPDAFTSDTGWKLSKQETELLKNATARLKKIGARVIFFVDPGFTAVKQVKKIGADGIEIYTGRYAELFITNSHATELRKIIKTARSAHKTGLHVHIGHDLNLKNLPTLISKIGALISEASIGHELTADALMYGFRKAVQKYREALNPVRTVSNSESKDPFVLFSAWHLEARGETQPNAMVISTASRVSKPSSRIVFLRDFSKRGFTFFTNYESRKGIELRENPSAALLFYWHTSGRQVRITGSVKKTSVKESEAYFATRPRESQLSAWASAQSADIKNIEILERKMRTLRKKYSGKKIPLPPHWGGFRVSPVEFEFWEQGDSGRVHKRTRYRKTPLGWKKTFLSP
jgi:pyridoxine 5-phosphate synthase